MSEIITPRKLSRLEQLEALPSAMQDDALVDWRTVTTLLATRDVEHTRKLFKARVQELGEKLVRLSSRRELPTWRTVQKIMASLAR